MFATAACNAASEFSIPSIKLLTLICLFGSWNFTCWEASTNCWYLLQCYEINKSKENFFPFHFAKMSQVLLPICNFSHLSIPMCEVSNAFQDPRLSFFLAKGLTVVEHIDPLVALSIAPNTVTLSA